MTVPELSLFIAVHMCNLSKSINCLPMYVYSRFHRSRFSLTSTSIATCLLQAVHSVQYLISCFSYTQNSSIITRAMQSLNVTWMRFWVWSHKVLLFTSPCKPHTECARTYRVCRQSTMRHSKAGREKGGCTNFEYQIPVHYTWCGLHNVLCLWQGWWTHAGSKS